MRRRRRLCCDARPQQFPAFQGSHTRWEGDDETTCTCLGIPPVGALRLTTGTETAVEDDDERASASPDGWNSSWDRLPIRSVDFSRWACAVEVPRLQEHDGRTDHSRNSFRPDHEESPVLSLQHYRLSPIATAG